MILLNTQEDIPEEFFVFVSKNNLLTQRNLTKTNCICSSAFLEYITQVDIPFANNYLKGIITAYSGNYKREFPKKYLEGSIDYLPFKINEQSDLGMISMFNNSITNEYNVEYNIEIFRKLNFPLYPSRMSSCYAFGDYQSCLDVSKKYGWDISTVRKFKLIPHVSNRVVKVNMEIISLERYANLNSARDVQTLNTMYNSYWTGFGDCKMELPTIHGRQVLSSGVIWEYLVEGILVLS